MTIPDVSGSTKTPIDITIDYKITDIKMTAFNFGDSTITLLPNVGVQLALPSTTCSLTMDWRYSVFQRTRLFWSYTSDVDIHGSGGATDNLDLSITVLINIQNSNGRPLMVVSSIDVDITSFDIKVSGGAAWFYQTFVDIFKVHQNQRNTFLYFKGEIHDVLQNAISTELSSLISNEAQDFVNEVTLVYAMYPFLEVDYSLTANAEITAEYSATDHKGTFIWTPEMDTCSYNNINLPLDYLTSPITFVVSYEMIDCISKLLFDRDYMNVTILPEMVPDNSPIRLNSSDLNLRRLVPNLYATYPDVGLEVVVTAVSPPVTLMYYSEGIFF
jgi:hypothetical protein